MQNILLIFLNLFNKIAFLHFLNHKIERFKAQQLFI